LHGASHWGVGDGRSAWLREVVDEVLLAQQAGVPVAGICLYPILDHPEWHDPTQWHPSGQWDLVPDASGHLRRVPVEDHQASIVEVRDRVRL
jgi:UDP-galactopyranose mutase